MPPYLHKWHNASVEGYSFSSKTIGCFSGEVAIGLVGTQKTYKWRLLEERETLDIFVDLDENVAQCWAFDVYLRVGMLAFMVDYASLD